MWENKKLGEVCEMIKRGVAPKYIEAGGICVLNQKCIRDHVINTGPSRRHNIEIKKVPDERYIQIGDVLVNSTGTGTLGRVAQVRQHPSEPTTVDTHVTIIRPKRDMFYNDFFGYMLVKIEEEITESGEGASGQTELARSKLENEFYVSYPIEIDEQKRIVAILDQAFEGIDKAIANTQANLASARELFESYLNRVFTEKGEDWADSYLNEIYDVRDGTHDSPKYQENGRALVTSKNLKRGELDFGNVKYISEQDYIQICKRSAVNMGDILFAMIGTIGNPVVVKSEPDFAIKNVALFKVPPKQNSDFLRYYLESPFVKAKMQSEAKGTTQKFVGLGYLRNFPISLPTTAKQNEIVELLNGFEMETTRLEAIYLQKLDALHELKQSILAKAFRGELTNSEAAA
ncbi:restriction endonuclease subunit S [Terasakiella pusilla]|uniref:restriction endonuclease subunit S n=1 Tax=Terasakiella pusilla TaxID=64973 RepID=UPI003AA7CF7C